MPLNTKTLEIAWRTCVILLLAMAWVTTPQLAFAAASNTPMGNVLCTVLAWAGGNAGRGVTTIGITVLGLGALLGKISWNMALLASVEIALVHGSASIVNSMGANVSGITGAGGAAAATTC